MQTLAPVTARRLLAPMLALAALALFVPGSFAASGGSAAPPFRQLVKVAQLITLADVAEVRGAGDYVLHVERIFKGKAGATLTFAPDDKAVALRLGSRVLLVQMDRRYLDFRGTFVWLVAPDGRLSDAGVTGQPTTLAEVDAAFGLPATDSVATTTSPASTDTNDGLRTSLVALTAALSFGVTLARFSRQPDRH